MLGTGEIIIIVGGLTILVVFITLVVLGTLKVVKGKGKRKDTSRPTE